MKAQESDDIEEINASAYIPVSSAVFRLDESEYTYNKDSDEWQCSQGKTTVKKKRYLVFYRSRTDP
jgi:hypothetical protein